MYSQSFTPTELYRCTTQAERRNSGLQKDELIEAIGAELGNSWTLYLLLRQDVGSIYDDIRGSKGFDSSFN